jgi:hypothetical protein
VKPLALASAVCCLASLVAAAAEENPALPVFESFIKAQPSDEQCEMQLDIYRRIGTGEEELNKPKLSVRYTVATAGRGESARLRMDVISPLSMVGIAMTAEWDAKGKRFNVTRFLPSNSSLGLVAYLNTSFMQSHLLYEDAVPEVAAFYNLALLEKAKVDGVDCQVVEATPKTSSGYAKKVYFLRQDNSRPVRIDYYSREYRGPELKMTRTFKADGGEEWLLVRTGEKSVLTVLSRKSGAPADDRFKPESLKSDPAMVQLMGERSKLLEEELRLRREIEALKAELQKTSANAR